jgi:hypothetical protein
VNSKNISRNFASGSGAGFYISGLVNPGDKLDIMNCVITNNYSWGASYAAGIVLNNCTNNRGLMLSNCIIDGTNAAGTYMISESGTVNNHVLVSNTFITNLTKYFYYDSVKSGTNNIAALNDASYSGAAEAQGNRAQ